jgi:hypothetical protein
VQTTGSSGRVPMLSNRDAAVSTRLQHSFIGGGRAFVLANDDYLFIVIPPIIIC